MSRRLRRLVLLVLLVSFPAQFARPQSAKVFSGHVFDAQTKRGIENLEVKLRPPSNSSAPVLMGGTDQNGVFRFSEVKPATYLLEISQGPYLLYRAETDTSKTDNVEIPIQRR
jgi:hypothetical protein